MSLLIFRKSCDNDFDLYWHDLHFFRVQINPRMEVVLVDDGASGQSLRAEHKVDAFQESRFSGVVVADQNRMAFEMNLRILNAAKITRCDPDNLHELFP